MRWLAKSCCSGEIPARACGAFVLHSAVLNPFRDIIRTPCRKPHTRVCSWSVSLLPILCLELTVHHQGIDGAHRRMQEGAGEPADNFKLHGLPQTHCTLVAGDHEIE